jgi:hypothetical protein
MRIWVYLYLARPSYAEGAKIQYRHRGWSRSQCSSRFVTGAVNPEMGFCILW